MPKQVDFERVKTAVDWSIKQMATPRKLRIDAIRQYVGAHYADNGNEKRVPTNFLELAVTIYTRQLAARAPRVMIEPNTPSLRPYAKDMELAINQVPDEIHLGNTLRKAVVEAMFAFAVAKVGIASSGKVSLGHDEGSVFVDLVSLDDYFCDMSATSRDAIQYEGNDYWVCLDDARAMAKGEKIEPDKHTVTGSQGEQRADGVSVSEGADLYEEKVWLRDVWLPEAKQIVTYGVKSGKLLRTVEWKGPTCGPYHILGFSDVPGNLFPLPPVALWRDLHELGNNLFRKLGRQADSKKTVAAFQGGNDDDANALKNASDGEGIKYSGQKPESITVGGIDAPTLAFYMQVRDLFSYFAGNLDTLGGLAPQSSTVGQDKLLAQSASARLKTMSEQTIDFAKGIFKSLAFYEWEDPVKERTIEKFVPGTDVSIRKLWTVADRKGKFEDYNFDIDVYSMQDDSPSEKLQKIGMALERFVFPALPMLQAQGGQIDFKELLSLIGRLGNIPELSDLVKFQNSDTMNENQAEAQGGEQEPPGMPANTTRTYERVGRPGATQAGKTANMMQALMTGKDAGGNSKV